MATKFSMFSMKGKVVAVTGAASGIAYALAEMLAEQGAKLALADIQAEPLEKFVSDLKSRGVEAVGTVLDVGSSEDVNKWIESTIQHFGRLDGAANIAGVEHGFVNLTDLTDEAWDRIIRVNLSGLMYCVRAQIRVMQSGAAIVNASSYAGIAARAGMASYVSSKHGVVGITKTAAREVGPRGIRVNAIAPGPIDTPMLASILSTVSSTSSDTTNSHSQIPLQRKGEPEEVARLITFLLSDNASYINGTIVSIDGGLGA